MLISSYLLKTDCNFGLQVRYPPKSDSNIWYFPELWLIWALRSPAHLNQMLISGVLLNSDLIWAFMSTIHLNQLLISGVLLNSYLIWAFKSTIHLNQMLISGVFLNSDCNLSLQVRYPSKSDANIWCSPELWLNLSLQVHYPSKSDGNIWCYPEL